MRQRPAHSFDDRPLRGARGVYVDISGDTTHLDFTDLGFYARLRGGKAFLPLRVLKKKETCMDKTLWISHIFVTQTLAEYSILREI